MIHSTFTNIDLNLYDFLFKDGVEKSLILFRTKEKRNGG